MRLKLFKEFLNFFWLRPENALLLSLRAEIYQSTFRYFGDGSDTVDVSCGDGMFSFISFGGKLSKQTDMFRSLNLSQKREGVFDVFDAFDDEYSVNVEQFPDKSYEFGTDWKKNLLLKAEKLNFYNKLIEHDNNLILPFPDGSMKYVYSNSAYWVDEFKNHLIDLARITSKNGKIVLEMKTSEISSFTSSNYLPAMGNSFHKIIDAGRLETWAGLRSKDEILEIIDQIPNTRILSVQPIYGDIMAVIWDIGLRPVFSPLVKMANRLNNDDRANVKEEWCQIFEELFSEILKDYKAEEKSAIEYCIILEKK